uniref:Signal peptide peptidase SppA n=1 Tax=candidate division WOR-3 bacterium TaxID=2052148 RepID=A0A7V3ZZF8_UNCW3
MKRKWWLWVLIGVGIIYVIANFAITGLEQSIAVVRISGTISSSREVVREIEGYSKNPNVKGLLLIINSPGGGIVPSDEIYRSILRFKESRKPVVAYLATVAASGGYYIACASDYIVSHPLSLTGSIGTIIEYPVIKGLLDKVGIDFVVIKSGKVKDIASPFKEISDEERKILQNIIEQGYNNFVDVVARGRKLERNKVLEIADGRVLTGNDAFKLGLVDTVGDEFFARKKLKEIAKIRGPVRWIERKKLPFFMRYVNPDEVFQKTLEIKFDYRMVFQ